MNDTTFFVLLVVLFVGLLYALLALAYMDEKIRQLKENLNFTRERVSFLEQLHMKEGGEE